MNVAVLTIRTGLTSEKNDFFLGPILVSCHRGHRSGFEAARFGLHLVPGANFLLYKDISFGSYVDLPFGDNRGTGKMATLWPDTVWSNKVLNVNVHKAGLPEPLL